MLYPNGEFSLGLSITVKSHKPPTSSPTRERSGKPQTSYSRRMVRNAVAKLERQHGRDNVAFVTYTLPDFAEADMNTIREAIAEVVRQLKQALERDLSRAGIKPEVVYVIEIHEERYRKTGQIIPHIHAVFQSRKTRSHPYAISKQRNTELWNRAVSNVLGRRVEMPWAANIQKVKKSAEAYLAKYMSKGAKLAQEAINNGQEKYLPKQWWGASLSLRRWVKKHTKILSDNDKQVIKDHYKDSMEDIKSSPFSWLGVYNIKSTEPGQEERDIPVSIFGKIRDSFMSMFECRQLSDAPMSWEW